MKKLNLKSAGAVLVLLFVGFTLSSCVLDLRTDKNETGIYEWTGDQNYKSPVSLPELSNQSENLEKLWWKKSAFYHIWVKSFKDSDLNSCLKNCGDFKGIEDSLDYIQNDLGCDAIWLSPIWDCAYKGSNMHGYDVVDFYKLNPYFGTGDGSDVEAELDSLIAACHKRGMKIIFDFVPNHTSNENQWFIDSVNKQNGKKDWYVWNKKKLDGGNVWGENPWHYNSVRSAYYYTAFVDTQPDLNFRNYEVREEMKNVVRYWLNRGFDGLRIDAVRYLVETEDSKEDTDETHAWFAELRKVIDEYESPKFMVCEAWIENDRTSLNKYFGTSEKPEFNMVLDFDQGWNCIDDVNDGWNKYLTSRLFFVSDDAYSYGTFLGNHDNYHARLGDWFGSGTNGKSVEATALSLLRPTVPFIYYGNEIGQCSNPSSTSSNDPDERLRQPFEWDIAASQKSDSASLLNVNKALLQLRKSEKYADLFANGKVSVLDINMIYIGTTDRWNGAAAYTISYGNQKLLVVANFRNSKEARFWFGKSGLGIAKQSLIVGNKDVNTEIYNGKWNDGGEYIIMFDFAPNEIRVYDMTSDSEECVLDVWDYNFTGLYLRGTMNSWQLTEMSNDSSGSFSTICSLIADNTYEFKFDECGDWASAFGSVESDTQALLLGESADSCNVPGSPNFSFTPDTDGDYTISFNPYTKKVLVTK